MPKYEYKYIVPREFQEEMYFLFEQIDPNYNYHGFEFENDTFIIRPYNWNDDCNCAPDLSDEPWEAPHDEGCHVGLPNFHYKPENFALQWYKYPLRASEMNQEIDFKKFREIISKCVESLKKGI